MDIKKTFENGVLTLEVSGRVDTITAPELQSEVESVDAQKTIFDFANLDYISSAGLRVLLSTQKRMTAKQGTMILRNVDSIKEVLEITGFYDIFTIE